MPDIRDALVELGIDELTMGGGSLETGAFAAPLPPGGAEGVAEIGLPDLAFMDS
jgi:hypothetical protein